MYFERTLENGVRVVGQKIEGFRSVSVGIWIGTGSANEVAVEERGVFILSSICSLKGPKGVRLNRLRLRWMAWEAFSMRLPLRNAPVTMLGS